MRKAPVFDGLDVIAHCEPFAEAFVMSVRKPGIGTAEQFGDLTFRYEPVLHERTFRRFIVRGTGTVFFAETEAQAHEIADWTKALYDMGHAMWRRERDRLGGVEIHRNGELVEISQGMIDMIELTPAQARELARELLDVLG